jgi:hypothetical protein
MCGIGTEKIAGIAIMAAVGLGQRYTPAPSDVRPVPMQASCTAEAAADVDRGAAWLLLLAPGEARRAFERAADADPDCALAYWGQAVSHFPVADEPPARQALAEIRRAADRARTVPASTPFARAAVDALTRFLAREAAPGVGAAWPARLAAYRDALCPAAAAPDATEPMRLFCARAHVLTSSLPGDLASLEARRLAVSGARDPASGTATTGPAMTPGAAIVLLQTEGGSALSPHLSPALTALALLTAPAPAAHHLALRAAVRLGDWARATVAGERALAAAGPDGVYALLAGARAEYAPEWLLEAYLQQGRIAAATRFTADSRAALLALDPDDPRGQGVRQALARMDARLAIATRRWPAARADDPAAVPSHETWTTAFVDGLGAALRAWPGGDPAHLARARTARDQLAALTNAARLPSEIAWAATLVDAAMAASQDEHPQMELLFTHAIDLEVRLREAGRLSLPLVPARELAAELWLRTYRYPDAVREARAALEMAPHRAMPHAILGRTAVRLRDASGAAEAYRRLRELRRDGDPDDELRREALAFLSR